MSNEEEVSATAKEIDRLTAALGQKLRELRPATHLATAMALTKLAAEAIFHDKGTTEDFLAVAQTAWDKVASDHAHGVCKH